MQCDSEQAGYAPASSSTSHEANANFIPRRLSADSTSVDHVEFQTDCDSFIHHQSLEDSTNQSRPVASPLLTDTNNIPELPRSSSSKSKASTSFINRRRHKHEARRRNRCSQLRRCVSLSLGMVSLLSSGLSSQKDRPFSSQTGLVQPVAAVKKRGGFMSPVRVIRLRPMSEDPLFSHMVEHPRVVQRMVMRQTVNGKTTTWVNGVEQKEDGEQGSGGELGDGRAAPNPFGDDPFGDDFFGGGPDPIEQMLMGQMGGGFLGGGFGADEGEDSGPRVIRIRQLGGPSFGGGFISGGDDDGPNDEDAEMIQKLMHIAPLLGALDPDGLKSLLGHDREEAAEHESGCHDPHCHDAECGRRLPGGPGRVEQGGQLANAWSNDEEQQGGPPLPDEDDGPRKVRLSMKLKPTIDLATGTVTMKKVLVVHIGEEDDEHEKAKQAFNDTLQGHQVDHKVFATPQEFLEHQQQEGEKGHYDEVYDNDGLAKTLHDHKNDQSGERVKRWYDNLSFFSKDKSVKTVSKVDPEAQKALIEKTNHLHNSGGGELELSDDVKEDGTGRFCTTWNCREEL